jgi:hypothetical protein
VDAENGEDGGINAPLIVVRVCLHQAINTEEFLLS